MKAKLTQKDILRLKAEASLETFIRLIHPNRILGSVHSDLLFWWTRPDSKSHQLTLLPRDHQKSALLAYRCAWEIARNPAIRILYLSSTSNLAVKQLKFIKDILLSERFRYYWPEMVNPNEQQREKWTETEIAVDHPERKRQLIRDPTIFTAGLTTTITGMHCDVAALDDIVVYENAYSEEGRRKVQEQYELLSAIEGADGREWAVGTRYYQKDLYSVMQGMVIEELDEYGEIINTDPLYEVFEKQVESAGDGTGEFLWPRTLTTDGKYFGFDAKVLAKKKAQYTNQTQFRAQYYNDPNDTANALIPRENFQYFEKSFLRRDGGKWYYKGNRLNIIAAIDFAYSLADRADYTSIVIVGVDLKQNYYVMDIERFKTKKISEYFDKILAMHQKWDFRTLVAEVTAAQDVIVEDLKTSYIRVHGLALAVKDYKPTRNDGTKAERIQNVLQHRYENRQIWHYRGGNCQVLEEELMLEKPPHDDVKDALTAAIMNLVPPSSGLIKEKKSYMNYSLDNRFGGMS